MDKVVNQLTEMTSQLVERLEQVTEQEILTFLNVRELIIERMKLDQLSEDDRNRYRSTVLDVLQQDQRILSKLNLLRQEATEGMSKLEDGKRQKSAYDVHYPHESLYFDRKK